MTVNATQYEVVVVGGGFGGTQQLHHLRSLGFNVHLFEAGGTLGGIWYWNCYPGARVDTECPVYQLTAPELFKDWTWTERYPHRDELVKYFQHVAKVWDLEKDISFHSRVDKAHWNAAAGHWDLTITQKTPAGSQELSVQAKSVIFCTGFASKTYKPDIPGMDSFKGLLAHTAEWPQEPVELAGKRIAVIGTGASGVQVAQTVAPDVAQLTVFQRTPNLALPMGQRKLTKENNEEFKRKYPELVKKTRSTYAGFLYDFDPRKCFEVTEEERLQLYEELYNKGGVFFWLGTFSDVLKDKKANDTAYEFWRKKTLERIDDPAVAEMLAPKVAPHPYGTKRVSLEQNYFETFNRPNVKLVDLKKTPIERITEKGIKTSDAEYEFDIICLATGFDAGTGGLTQLDIRGENNELLADKWANGVRSYFGMMCAGFPNMFMVYGPQAPTAFATGPSCAEAQGDWIVQCITHLRDAKLKSIQPTVEAENAWREHVNTVAEDGLYSQTKSWYFGDNVPGKPREALNYLGGMQVYKQKCRESRENGYKEFVIA